jgi:hypothetical protein
MSSFSTYSSDKMVVDLVIRNIRKFNVLFEILKTLDSYTKVNGIKYEVRYLLIFIFNLLTASFLQGQTLAEKIALKACGHLDSIDNFQILHDSIRPSLSAANLFVAHRIYVETNSGYKEDSEQLMSIEYRQLKEENKLDLMKQKAAEHNVTIEY